MNQEVDWFFNNDTKWKEEYQKLRTFVLNCGLVEELKWEKEMKQDSKHFLINMQIQCQG